MACCSGEVKAGFDRDILTGDQWLAAWMRYNMTGGSDGMHGIGRFVRVSIRSRKFRRAFRRKTLYGCWLRLVELVWNDIREREGNPAYSFRRARRFRDVEGEICELALDFKERNRLLVWEQFVNACMPFSKQARSRLARQAFAGGNAEYLECGVPNGPGLSSFPKNLKYVPTRKKPSFLRRLMAWKFPGRWLFRSF